jgi:hypothetical protein
MKAKEIGKQQFAKGEQDNEKGGEIQTGND